MRPAKPGKNSGVPQGGPLSPLCGNIMLNELDRELERRGHKYVRYADMKSLKMQLYKDSLVIQYFCDRL